MQLEGEVMDELQAGELCSKTSGDALAVELPSTPWESAFLAPWLEFFLLQWQFCHNWVTEKWVIQSRGARGGATVPVGEGVWGLSGA